MRVSCLSLLLVCSMAFANSGKPLSENDKIEALIHSVETLKDVSFIRNGVPYDAPAAAKHLREKWQWKKGSIKTAHDFILLAGSSSSQTGQPYRIRFKDGHEVKSADFFTAELKKLEDQPAP
jgi:hypothetical protein